MLPNPWLILAVVLSWAGAFIAGERLGHSSADTEWTARIEKERADAAQAARAEEQAQQEKVNEALRKQNTSLAVVATRLRGELDRLRDRPERPANLPDAPRPACTGATGAELSRSDAGFLAGEAARADELRAGLEACYAVIDAMNKKGPAP